MAAEIVRIQDPDSGAEAQILVSLGFNCFSWKAPFTGGGEKRELLWAEEGFDQGDKRPSRSGIPLLFPFPGRLRGDSVRLNGQTIPLEEGDGAGNAIHGYAMWAPWRVRSSSQDSITAEFQPSVDAPDKLGMWTGDYRIAATYRIQGSRLELEATFENVGETALPWGFGTHAYFRLPLSDGNDPEETLLRAPLESRWVDENVVPTGLLSPLGDHEGIVDGAPLAGAEFDTMFKFQQDESPTTEIVDPATGHAVRQTCDAQMTTCVIYTPGHREAVCLEPYTCVPNAPELETRGVATGLQHLPPGESASTRVTLEALTLT